MDPVATFYTILIVWTGVGILLAAWLTFSPGHRKDPAKALRRAGITTTIVGTLTAFLAVFVPFGVYTRVTDGPGAEWEETSYLESMWAIGIEPMQLLILAIVGSISWIIGISATIHQFPYSQFTRWVAVNVLCLITLLGSFSIGWMFIPVTALALVTAILGQWATNFEEHDDTGEKAAHSGSAS